MMWAQYTLFVLVGNKWYRHGFTTNAEVALSEQQHFEYVVGVPAKIGAHYFAGPRGSVH